ncbi:MAG: aminotransferase class I/II-fold pyridoxal phosphate-dependent enzyme [Ktedonobacteraceae bacterium]
MPHVPDDIHAEMAELLSRPPDPFAAPTQTLAFEATLAEYFGVKEAVAVCSGTAALHCALAALGIGPGDEILVPALSVVMSAVPIVYQQATPVFVDCQPGRVDFDYQDLKRKTTVRTRAILPVYLWGCSYTMQRLLDYAQHQSLWVIEDACQAHGTMWSSRYLGTWGHLGCFSMRDGKLLSTGEGGFLLTNHPELAQRCRSFRSHWANPHDSAHSYERLGHNYRLAEWQALLGRAQVRIFPTTLAHRRWQTEYLLTRLADVPEVEPYVFAPEEIPNYFSPVLLLRESLATRRIAERLSARGVRNSVGTFGLKPAGEWPVFREAGQRTDGAQITPTPNAAAFLERVLALILLPQYGVAELDALIATIIMTIEEEIRHARGTRSATA